MNGSASIGSRRIRSRVLLATGGALCAVSVMLAGCTDSGKKDPFAGVGSPVWKGPGPMPKGGGRRHVGKPYEVAGNWFYPKAEPTYDRTGVASWYGPRFNRRMTSNGEWFDMEQLTAAHTTMELPSYAMVTNLENGRQVVVRVNDRGPFVNDRIIDMSKKSADLLGFRRKGRARVRVQYIAPAPLQDPDYAHLAAMNDEMKRQTPLNQLVAGADLRSGRYGEAARQTAMRQPAGLTAQPQYRPQAAGGYYVQVAAFANPANAERARSSLADIANVEVTPASSSIGAIYRVRLGPISSQDMASAALDAVRSRGHVDAVLRQATHH